MPLIEAALAVMRLSTEKFFVLLSLYVAFLLFRTPPPAVARLISITARVSNAFARMVLYTFPCVCWVYGAGFVFSSLVSGELVAAYEKVTMNGNRQPRPCGCFFLCSRSRVFSGPLA